MKPKAPWLEKSAGEGKKERGSETVENGFSYKKNGWTYISVRGSAIERGIAYGYLIADQFEEIQKMLEFIAMHDYGQPWEFFVKVGRDQFKAKTKSMFPEWYEEMDGIAKGCNMYYEENGNKTQTTLDEILAWNNYFTILDSWYPHSGAGSGSAKEGGGQPDRCSAFIATGSFTKNGQIVCAHNSFSGFTDGQYMNCILDIQPTKGARMMMQTSPCWMWSGTDFFVTSRGIIGTETTIGGFLPYENNVPIAYRIRNAMQYGKTLDDYVSMLLDGNSGDYANSWLFGDIHTGEILRIELGLKYHNVERTKDGYYVGFNAVYDPRIRNLECGNHGFDDIRRHQGARRVRLTDLMELNRGKIDVNKAMSIIADHYDVYLKKINKCSRTICSHYEMDPREYMSQADRPKPFQPKGAVDGCVVDSDMARNMSFLARYGSSCGTPFSAQKFCNTHRQWAYLLPYLRDRKSQPWTTFTASNEEKEKGKEKGKRTKRKRQKGKETKRNVKLISK